MKRIAPARAIALLLLFATAAFCQATAAAPARKLLMWKATSGRNTAYLFGSIHVADKSMYPLPQPVEDAFAASDVLVVEVNLDQATQQKVTAQIMTQGMYSGNDSLWNHVSSETRAQVERFCKANGLPAEFAARMKPWMLSVTVAMLPVVKSGMDMKLGVDLHFLEEAKDTKRIQEIESADWQLSLFDSFPDDAQEKMLADSIRQFPDLPAQLKELVAAWKSGDPARLDAVTKKGDAGPDEITHQIREARNPHMAEVVEQCLKDGDHCFVVVGAAHLVGKESVIDLLRRHGLKVEQMSAPRP